jgi:hypothetical protein
MTPQISQLKNAQPCGLVRDGRSMTTVPLADVIAAHDIIELLEAHNATLRRDLETVTETKDRAMRMARAAIDGLAAVRDSAEKARCDAVA